MARVTVEDCLRQIPDHFKMVEIASGRARSLLVGMSESSLQEKEDDKPTVLALREVAAGLLTEDGVQEDDVLDDVEETI